MEVRSKFVKPKHTRETLQFDERLPAIQSQNDHLYSPDCDTRAILFQIISAGSKIGKPCCENLAIENSDCHLNE